MPRSFSWGVLITAALVVVIQSTAVSAQTLSFERQNETGVTDAPRAIAVADVTADGWQDVIVAGTGRGSITVLPAHGQARDYVLGGGPFDLAVGDLNRDGRLDVAVANADADTINLLFNNGSGEFTSQVDLAVAGNPRGVAVGDFNRDGIPDVAATTFAAGTLVIWFGAGDGTFPTHRVHEAPVNPQGMAVADFNHDGWNDIGVAAASGDVRIYEMFATGAVVRDLHPSGNGWNVLAAGDLDRDGRVDLAVASTGSSLVQLLYNRASGWTSGPAVDVASSPRGIAIGDLNQDGTLEIVVAGRAADSVTVISRAATGTLTAANFAAGPGARAVALADFDRTGRVGIATANEFGPSATILRNITDLGPEPAFSFRPGSFPEWYDSILAVGDFNENGTPDVLVRQRVSLDGGAFQIIDSSNYYARTGAAADVNNDGHLDAVFSGISAILVFLGDGRGGFTRGPTTPLSLDAWSMQIADMNRDGRADIVQIVTDFYTTAALEVYLGRGDGSFTRMSATAISNSARGLTLGDLNRDGILDAVIADDGGVTARLGDGTGGWKDAIWFEAGVPRYGVALGDVTGDGILDLATSDMDQFSWGVTWGTKITVARGVGDGTFERLHQYDVKPEGAYDWVYSLTLVDMNADGALDIFTTNGHLLKGNNAGDFQGPDRFATFGTGSVIADLNNDSLPDLVGYSTSYGSSGVFLNTRTPPSANQPPTGFVTRDEQHWGYETYWYAEDESYIFAGYITDPDLHAIRYTWTMNGQVVGHDYGWAPEQHTPPGRYDVTVTVDDYRGASLTDSFTLIIDPFKETVLLPAADAVLHGAWQISPDPTASIYEQVVRHPDAGAPKIQTALAQPADYFEMGFVADPTQEYKLWIRLKADNDNWANDSVFVQFSGAKDAAGNPIYQIGTTSALAVNLEECSNCGVSGWGWEDDGWGGVNVNGTTLRFPEGGAQTIRIQTREDGVSIDAVVLSAETYKTTRPGTAKDDTTILPHRGPWVYPNSPR